ncbi:MAG: 2Fe-2S iron-sulfur cluster-binding protein [Acetobacter sp.]
MPLVTFIQPDGISMAIDAPLGMSVMQVATQNAIAGIIGECGGACACATCHVHIDPPWVERLPAPTSQESEMLEFSSDVKDNSRLGCQIRITDDLDGLLVYVPASQG